MTSGADLFVVCKQCGSEVSPYVTECPYCGTRLRRRAPKLPRAGEPVAPPRRRLLGARQGARRSARPGHRSAVGYGSGRWEGTRPYATISLVALSAAAWIAFHAHPAFYGEVLLAPGIEVHASQVLIVGPLHHHWWRLLSTMFAYSDGVYAFATLVTVGLFGWLVEKRHGPAMVLALFLGAGVAGGLAACAVYTFPVVGGGNAGALALLGAWAAPDLRAARAGDYYEGDLMGAAAIAALILLLPFGLHEASWLAGALGGAIGLLGGLGLSGMAGERA